MPSNFAADWRWVLGIALGLALAPAAVLAGNGDQVDAATLARIATFDKGPAAVDVGRYPALAQSDYKVFRQTCSVCHTLARPINSDFALPEEWSRYVKRMMFKPGSNITPVKAKKVYLFLVYDSAVRKKALFDSKLAAESPADRAANEAKVREAMAALGSP